MLDAPNDQAARARIPASPVCKECKVSVSLHKTRRHEVLRLWTAQSDVSRDCQLRPAMGINRLAVRTSGGMDVSCSDRDLASAADHSSPTSSSPYISSSLASSFVFFTPAAATSFALSSSIFWVRKTLMSFCICDIFVRTTEMKVVLASTESESGTAGKAEEKIWEAVGEA